MKKLLLASSIFFLSQTSFADSPINLCFTPGENCTQEIVDEINGAKKDVYVQAFVFTSTPIANALVDAKNRGVTVNIIFDKTQRNDTRDSCEAVLEAAGIPMWTDYKVQTAHNKVMIIDKEKVITGSFNFTFSAQWNNAENVLIINDSKIASAYFTNWEKRKSVSRVLANKID
jgi:phosphatidylserine/phosphatidylglycerophosphate/cardiolipin synthase-like enzyme